MNIPMGHQGPQHQFLIALGAADTQAEYLPVIETLSRHPKAAGLLGVTPYHTTGLALHTHRISHIVVHTNLVKQLRQEVDCLMYLF